MFASTRKVRGTLLAIFAVIVASQAALAQSEISPPLWEIRSGEATGYLFGTIHVGTADFYPLPVHVQSAFQNSDTVALEADPNNAQQAASALAIAMYTPPDNIENHLEMALLSRVQQATSVYGLPFQQLRQMKPYMLMFTLTMLEYGRLGYNAMYGLDTHFSKQARREGKQIVELESMQQQMSMLDNLSSELQSAMLEVTVDEIISGEVSVLSQEMMSAWRSGDGSRLMDVMSAEERKLPPSLANEFRSRFLTERNVTMAQRIDQMIKSGKRVFVAVGALHMVGDKGIPALLSDKGYQVRPL